MDLLKIPSDVSGSHTHTHTKNAFAIYTQQGKKKGEREGCCIECWWWVCWEVGGFLSWLSLSLLISLAPTADGPRPTQKEIISLRAFMLLFLKQLILKVKTPPVFTWPRATDPHAQLAADLRRGKIWRLSTNPSAVYPLHSWKRLAFGLKSVVLKQI